MRKILISLLSILLISCNIEDKTQNFNPGVSNEETKLENDLFLLHNKIYQIHQKINIALQKENNLNDIFTCATIDSTHLTNDTILFTINFGFGLCSDSLENQFIGNIYIKQFGNLLSGNAFYAEILSNDLQINQNEIVFNDTLSLFQSLTTQKIVNVKGSQNIILNSDIVSRRVDRRYTFTLENIINSFTDLSYTIEGSTSVSDGESINFISIINTKLQFNNKCNYITSGEMEILPQRKIKRTVNFGNTVNCDNKVNISVGSLSKEFDLNE
jgi:hypothetical protein